MTKFDKGLNAKPTLVRETIQQCLAAHERMSMSNPHKLLMYNAAAALAQLTERLDKAEKRVKEVERQNEWYYNERRSLNLPVR